MSDGHKPEEGGEEHELHDLEPLHDAPDLEPIHGGGDLEELPAGSERQAPPPAPGTEGSAATPAGPGEARQASGPRELERAPLMLQKAALVLAVAALFPWLAPGGWTVPHILAKAIVLVGGYLLYAGVLFRHGEKVPGPVAAIGRLHGRALGILGTAVMLVGVLPIVDASGVIFGPMVEKAALALGIATWCQVLSYEKGGRFNPVLGLAIPLLGIAALGRIVTLFTPDNFEVFALIGSAGVVTAAFIAGYTMVLAMKEAKAHGEAKKKAAIDARKAARAERR